MKKEENKKKIYVTKYFSTLGIVETYEIPNYTSTEDRPSCSAIIPGYIHEVYLSKNEFFFSKEDAKKNFEKRKNEKILSLKKQIEKIEKINFDI
jgi:hypothetical protein